MTSYLKFTSSLCHKKKKKKRFITSFPVITIRDFFFFFTAVKAEMNLSLSQQYRLRMQVWMPSWKVPSASTALTSINDWTKFIGYETD